jgi:hypothetical protein
MTLLRATPHRIQNQKLTKLKKAIHCQEFQKESLEAQTTGRLSTDGTKDQLKALT